MLREASPSGIVIDRDSSVLFSCPERHFNDMAIDSPIVEALFVPFHTEGKPVGTLYRAAQQRTAMKSTCRRISLRPVRIAATRNLTGRTCSRRRWLDEAQAGLGRALV